MVAWIMANWQAVALAVLAIDSALIPLFPASGLLISIKNLLAGVAPKA